MGLPEKVNDWVYRPFNVNRLHAYAIRGGEMLRRVHRHITDRELWKPKHHIDHHLGEFHKTRPAGLYVPRQWLIAKSEGHSNINGRDLPARLFRGAEALCDPRFDREMVVVLGPYSGGTSAVAGMLHYLGIKMGGPFYRADAATSRGTFEAARLGHLCRKIYSEPWLTENVPKEMQSKVLRVWAANRPDLMSKPDRPLGAKHPLLCLMGHEISEAWNRPTIVSVERPYDDVVASLVRRRWGWSIDAIANCIHQLMLSRELYLANYSGPVLRVEFDQVLRKPHEFVEHMGELLTIDFRQSEVQRAIAHVTPQ